MAVTTDALAVLAAPGRSPEIPEADDAYGWLVGSWDLDVLHYWTDMRGRGLRAEAHSRGSSRDTPCRTCG